MSDAKSLLTRISAFRERLEKTPALLPAGVADDPAKALPAAAKQAKQPEWVGAALRHFGVKGDSPPPAPAVPTKLTERARRVLESARDLVAAQRAVTDDVFYVRLTTQSDLDPLVSYHRSTVSATEAALRLVQTMPDSPEAQIRTCDGLDTLLNAVRDRLTLATRSLDYRRRDWGRVERLARLFCDIQARRLVGFDAVAGIAEEILDEARQGQPIRFLDQPVEPVARFAAAHGVVAAQVMARIVPHDYEWAGKAVEAVAAALLLDVGMLAVSPAVLKKTSPLDAADHSHLEKHPTAAAQLLRDVMPEAGELADAIAGHHERLDGTGYPRGLKGDSLSSLARLLAVVDVYAGMTCDRPHRPGHDPRVALTDTLLLAEKGQLDRDMAELLMHLSFYPVGTVVELTDGRTAVVVSIHTGRVNVRATMRPVVAVLTDAGGNLLPKPDIVDLAGAEYGGIVRALTTTEKRTLLSAAHPDLC